jgi:hypothetical protein
MVPEKELRREGQVKILDMSVVAVRKPLISDTRECDCCGKTIPRKTKALRGKVREGYATTTLYVCGDCETAYGGEEAIKRAHAKLVSDIRTMLANAKPATDMDLR